MFFDKENPFKIALKSAEFLMTETKGHTHRSEGVKLNCN